jgi:choline-sulfatase
MTCSVFIAAVMLGIGAGGETGSVSAGPTNVNVVLIMTDDQGAWSLGCYGNPEAHTPVLDHLATEGVRLSHAFAAIPVCSPSRATFFTGRIPSQHGIHDWIKHENAGTRERYCIPNETLISDILARHGYTCGIVGKWHLGDSMRPHASYSYWFVIPQGSSPYQDAEVIWQGKLIKTKGYLTDRITDRAIDFIEANRQRPFFLTVTYNAPHTPYRGHPADLVALYRDCPFASIPKAPLHPWASADFPNIGNHNSLSQYFAACSGVDRGVGRIVERIDKLGLGERTLVIYTSDQGFCVGHHGLWGKGNASNPRNMYDTSLQVPMIFRQTGRLPKDKVGDGLFSAYDLVPTLLDYLGLPPSPGRNLPGHSMATLVKDPQSGEGQEAIYAEYGRARMIRTKDWKLIHRADGGPDELYDLRTDPDEAKNLADAPEYRKQKIALRTKLMEWFDRYAEAGADPVGNEYLRPADR